MTQNKKLEQLEKIEDKLKIDKALEEKETDKKLKEAAPYDETLEKKRQAREEIKRKKQAASDLYDRVEKGEVEVVEKGKAPRLKGETVSEYVNTGLLALAVVLGKKPVGDIKFDLKTSCEKMADGLNKTFPNFAATLESGSGYADLAIGAAGIGKEVWDTITAEPIKPEEEKKDEPSQK